MDVINIRGLSFKRFLDIASLLEHNRVAVVTDNDGEDAADVRKRYAPFSPFGNISVHVGEDKNFPTLEPQLLKANGRAKLNTILGQTFDTDDELLAYMQRRKTIVALAIFETERSISMPGYIADAIA